MVKKSIKHWAKGDAHRSLAIRSRPFPMAYLKVSCSSLWSFTGSRQNWDRIWTSSKCCACVKAPNHLLAGRVKITFVSFLFFSIFPFIGYFLNLHFKYYSLSQFLLQKPPIPSSFPLLLWGCSPTHLLPPASPPWRSLTLGHESMHGCFMSFLQDQGPLLPLDLTIFLTSFFPLHLY